MVIYEFICNNCGHEFEELVKDKATSLSCPKCQSKEVKKLISAVKQQGAQSGQNPTACSPGAGFS